MGRGAYYFIDKYKLSCPCCGRYHYDKEFVRKLTEYEGRFGNVADYIVSGYRCSVFNEMVGGYPNSHHTMGLAIDTISIGHRYDRFFMGMARKVGIDLIKTGEFFHLYDWDQIGWVRPFSYYYQYDGKLGLGEDRERDDIGSEYEHTQ